MSARFRSQEPVLFAFATTLLTIITLNSSIFANSIEESTSLSSASADYNGNTLILKGNVILDHGLGKMGAEQAFLEKQEPGKDFPFSFIRLHKEVNIELMEQATLKCDTADFDFLSLKGKLLAKELGKVIYTNSPSQIRLMSDDIQVEMEKKEFDGKKTVYDLEKIHANGDIIVDYAQTFTLRADRALYQKTDTQRSVTVYPGDLNKLCHLSHEGDEIMAPLIYIDLNQSLLSLQQPKGKLLSSLALQIEKSEISFTANQLLWNHLKNILSLQGAVHIEEPSIGTIESDGVIQIAQIKMQGKRLIQSIRSQGKTILTYKEPSTQSTHQLINHGSFHLDREHMRLSLESPLVNGKVPNDKQLSYKEAETAVFADKAILEYALVEGTLQPISLLLKGNVRMTASEDLQPNLCGLSDRVIFSPATKTLILSAHPNKKVLFWDEEQGLSLSSQEIHITEDPSTHKRSIKGIGNVKFAFSNEENSLLQKIFPNYKLSHAL